MSAFLRALRRVLRDAALGGHSPPERWRCRHCDVALDMHLDHVGGCKAGCTGTWQHPPHPPSCRLRGRVVRHVDAVRKP